MSQAAPLQVMTLGLFEKRFEGDDCLMELARRRFLQAQMGAEMHAGTPRQLEGVMKFRPGTNAPVTVHLPRDFNLVDEAKRNHIVELATRFAGQVSGVVLHDHEAMAAHKQDYLDAARRMNDQLKRIAECPTLFIEYAAMLEPRDFAGFFSAIPDLELISPCVDIGHVGICAARAAFALKHGGEDIFDLKMQGPRLPQVIQDVEAAVDCGFATVLDLLEPISALRKRVHFHLHDGHPLSTFSPFGVADHLSFGTEIPLNFEHRGRRSLTPMFGADGLSKLVARTIELMGSQRISFTLEIHPTKDRLPLDDAASLFQHWADKTSPERMNHWLAVLSRNHSLLCRAIQAADT